MARMYPSKLPKHITENAKLSSEIRVYDHVRDKLPGDYICYYSRSWHEADDGGAEFDGEADFIVAHADHGLLFVEVKGGRVSCRESDGQWLSQDRDGFTFKIKSPLEQAKKSKHHFLRRLNESKRLAGRFIRARHGAILPGSARPSRPIAADAPLEIMVFGDDMPRLHSWLVQRMTEGGDPRERPLGLDGLKALEDILESHFELRAHIGISLADDAQTIERLTAEQAWILDSFEDNEQMSVAGGAGTGKTVLAIEHALRCADEGQRTLLTCFNLPLATYLERTCGNHENLIVSSFHGLCRLLAEQAGIELPVAGGSALFDKILPEALIDAVAKKPGLGFDTIIVDEGQDFQDFWFSALRLSLRDQGRNRFYVFYDDNQRLFTGDAGFIKELPSSTIVLSRNLRNTKKIHALMSKWYDGKRTTASGPEGEHIGLLECRAGNLAFDKVNERISHLVRSGQVKPGEIAVLTSAGADAVSSRKIAGHDTCRSENVVSNQIVFDTVRRFKGLSRPCVFVIGLEALNEPELIYVATSRANLLLELAGTSADIARITKAQATAK